MLLDWHLKWYKWFQKKTKLSGYAMAWIAFIKGLVIGFIIALWIS
jgi:hypothetical protein